MYTGQHLFFKKNLDSYYTIYAIVVYSIVGLAWIYVEYTYVEYMYFFNSFCWLSQYRFMLERWSVDAVRKNGNVTETSGLRRTGEGNRSKGEWQASNRGVTSRVSSARAGGGGISISFVRGTCVHAFYVCACTRNVRRGNKKMCKKNTKKTYPVDTRWLRSCTARANTCFFHVIIMLFVIIIIILFLFPRLRIVGRKPEASSTTGKRRRLV